MKIGDLVNFRASSWVFESSNRDYAPRNPGVIMKIAKKEPYLGDVIKNRFVAEIYWATGEVTREHDCYLERANE